MYNFAIQTFQVRHILFTVYWYIPISRQEELHGFTVEWVTFV